MIRKSIYIFLAIMMIAGTGLAWNPAPVVVTECEQEGEFVGLKQPIDLGAGISLEGVYDIGTLIVTETGYSITARSYPYRVGAVLRFKDIKGADHAVLIKIERNLGCGQPWNPNPITVSECGQSGQLTPFKAKIDPDSVYLKHPSVGTMTIDEDGAYHFEPNPNLRLGFTTTAYFRDVNGVDHQFKVVINDDVCYEPVICNCDNCEPNDEHDYIQIYPPVVGDTIKGSVIADANTAFRVYRKVWDADLRELVPYSGPYLGPHQLPIAVFLRYENGTEYWDCYCE